MAISIISSPKNPNTAFNKNKWVIDSTNKSEVGFRYTIKIINIDNSDVIKETEVAPRPVDGYGEFDISKVLSDQLDISLNFSDLDNNIIQQWNKFKLNYKLEFGEKYITVWEYDDTEFVSGSLSKCVQLGPTTSHSFLPGDAVVIIPATPSIRPTFQGLYNVNSLEIGTNFPVFNTPWLSNTPLNPGVIKYADNRPSWYDNLLTSSTFSVFKSTIDIYEWPDSNISDYQLGSNTKSLFTNFKDNYIINSDQDLYWPIDYDGGVICFWETNLGLTYSKTIANRTDDEYVRYINITPKSGLTGPSSSFYTDDLKYFNFWIEDLIGNDISRTYKINVDNRCKSSDIEILFEDRMGGFSSFAFDALYQTSINVNKEQYNQPIEMIGSSYDTTNIQGWTNITIDYDKEMTIRTKAILNKEQDIYFEELLTSGNTYIKINGTYKRVDILTKNGEFKQTRQSGLRRRDIRVRLSNKNTINF